MNTLPLVMVTAAVRLNLVTDKENGDTTDLHIMPITVKPLAWYEQARQAQTIREELTALNQSNRLYSLLYLLNIHPVCLEMVPYYYGANDNGRQ